MVNPVLLLSSQSGKNMCKFTIYLKQYVKLSLGMHRWRTFFDTEGEGRLIHMDHFREEVFYGGVEPELRKEAWKFLLGFYPSESTQEDRLLLTDDKVQEYQKIRSQWETISECQVRQIILEGLAVIKIYFSLYSPIRNILSHPANM